MSALQDETSKIATGYNYNIYRYDYDTLTTRIPVNTELGKKIQSSTYPEKCFNDFLKTIDAYCIYTDGSKKTDNSCVGSACFCDDLNIIKTKSIEKQASVCTAECIALNDALDIALENKHHNVCIFSDSLSALQVLKSPNIDIKINNNILEILKKYKQFLRETPNDKYIKFFWIPAHVGIAGNEYVDQLAKNATLSDTLNITKIPFSDLFEEFKKSSETKTRLILKEQGETKGSMYFKLFYNEQRIPWFSNVTLSRETIVTINRIRANHYNLAASLARINIISDDVCKCNEESETINHVLWQCKLYNNQRVKLIEALNKNKLQLPHCVESLVAEPNIFAIKNILTFIKKCNLSI